LVERSELAGDRLDTLLRNNAAQEGGDAHQAALRGEGQLLEQLLVDGDLVALLFVQFLGQRHERGGVLLVPGRRQTLVLLRKGIQGLRAEMQLRRVLHLGPIRDHDVGLLDGLCQRELQSHSDQQSSLIA